ncbi:Glycosylphosphatidylinositol specific phospholipase D1 [Linnemannia zychae]|nr:Glycosylphosphatidylinositol specific phospholipase D1 [Linnemannia zychae]
MARRLSISITCASVTTVALFLFFATSLVDACGVTIHNEVAFRASRILLSAREISNHTSSPVIPPHQAHSHVPYAHSQKNPLQYRATSIQDDYTPLLEQKDLLLAGSFFPDWGYNCIGKIYNDAAEEAHWPPFAEEAVRYILETYPKPWDDHTKQLITFLFGTVSHSLGDMSWHALRGLESGFIRVLADTSFGGDYSKGHTLADIGAEFVLGHMGKIDHLITSWKVPVKDITEIYKRMGYRVPGPVLSHCMRNGFAGIQANARLGSQLFPVYAPQSPFLVEQVENYPLGGLRDMTEWTVDCWHGLAQYLDEELPLPDIIDPIGTNTTFNLCYALWEERANTNHKSALENAREGNVRYGHAAIEGENALQRLREAGLATQTSTDRKTGMVTYSIERIARDDNTLKTQENIDVYTSFESTVDNKNDLANQEYQRQYTSHKIPTKIDMIKPSRSRANVCLTFSDELDSQINTLFLPIAYSSFGHAAVIGDFDGDGISELAIAAPHATYDPLVPSQGSVFIVPSQALYNNSNIQYDPEGIDVRIIASHVLHGDLSEPQSRFGWSMAIVDLNEDGIDDLAIGAPGHGAKDMVYGGSVFVYFGRPRLGLNNTPDVIIHHDRTKDRALDIPLSIGALAGLGYMVEGLDLTGSGFKDLVIGMPMAYGIIPTKPSNETKPPLEVARQTGKVVAFLASSKHKGSILDIDRDWELQGDAAFAWFGSSMAVITESFVQMKQLSRWSWLIPSWIRRKGNKDNEKEEIKERRILVVGSPTFGADNEQEAMRGHIQGFLLPNISSVAPPIKNPKKPLKPQWMFTIHGDTKFQQLGSRLLSSSQTSLSSPSGFKDLLVVGSQSEDVLNRLPKVGRQWQAGMVRIVDISQIENGTVINISDLDDDTSVIRDSLQGSQSMAHLSAAMEISTDGKSLWLAEPYAQGEAGRILEWEPNYSRHDDDEETDHHKRRRKQGRVSSEILRDNQFVFSSNGGDGGDEDDDGGGNDGDRIKRCFVGTDFRGRFGSQLLVTDLNKDGVDDIIVTSSHASQYAK